MNNKFAEDSFWYLFYFLIFIFAFRIWKPSFILAGVFVAVLLRAIIRKDRLIPHQIGFYFLFLAFLTYFIIDQINHGGFSADYFFSQLFHLLSMPLSYWIGWEISQEHSIKERETIFKRTMCMIAAGGSLYGILSLAKKILYPNLYKVSYLASRYAQNGLNSEHANRSVLDIWNNKIVYATEFNTQFLYLIALIPLFFNLKKINVKSIFFLILSVVAILWSSIETATRTNILMLIIISLYAVMAWNFSRENILSDSGSPQLRPYNFALPLVIAVFSLFIFLFIVIVKNTNNPLFSRLTNIGIKAILSDGRWTSAMNVFNNLTQYPYGGMNVYWAHNLWLDIARVAGIIPLFFIVAFSINNIILASNIWHSHHLKKETVILALSLFIILNVSFFLEPVIEGSPQQFMFYSLLVGLISQLLPYTNIGKVRLSSHE